MTTSLPAPAHGALCLNRASSIREFQSAVEFATRFLICAALTLTGLATAKPSIRLELAGVNEWLTQRNYPAYAVSPELRNWLSVFREVSSYEARAFADQLNIPRPSVERAVALSPPEDASRPDFMAFRSNLIELTK